ncbi:hypothetical protein [Streptomyces sulphureus]|uniref:hypothetical protein n=1 Tax=Streptomyces sulphureus TaxID=47758 RepID=UPI001FE11B08|nr:hypothetical protein [Streptomyces sulphureus]
MGSIAATAKAYGVAERRPVAPMPSPEPCLTIAGSRKTNPYIPNDQEKYCAAITSTGRARNTRGRRPGVGDLGGCGLLGRQPLGELGAFGLGEPTRVLRGVLDELEAEQPPHHGGGALDDEHHPPVGDGDEHPETAESHMTVTGLPRMRKVFPSPAPPS